MLSAALRPVSRTGLRAFSTSGVSARDVAKMTLVGRLGVIEQREGKDGKPYLMYKIATTDRGRPAQEGEEYQKPPTSWHTVFARGPAIERLSLIEKGSLVFAEASFTSHNVKDEQTGTYNTIISASHERLTVLKRPNRPEEHSESAPSAEEQQ
ncbi:hypothetical protein JCM10212_002435 [Sporobolomyces blumeae]